LSNLLTK